MAYTCEGVVLCTVSETMQATREMQGRQAWEVFPKQEEVHQEVLCGLAPTFLILRLFRKTAAA